MSVTVTETAAGRIEITWDPTQDDPRGYLSELVTTGQLAHTLEAIGYVDYDRRGHTPEQALEAARCTTIVARLLDRRAAVQVVQLRDRYGLSWRRIAEHVRGSADSQSSIRRMYDAGLRWIGI